MAGHLERVAKQARELAKLLEPHLGDAEWYTEESAVETIAEFLAAALAACARDAKLEEALWWADGSHGNEMAKRWPGCRKCERIDTLRALERAAGESK